MIFEQLPANEYIITLIVTSKMNVVDTIKFIDFCKLLDRIKYSRKQNEKENNLKKFLGELRSKIQNDSSLDKNLYQVMRLLLPKLERERGPYGLKEAAMAKIIIRALGLSNKSNDAYVLNNFTSMEKGDFADTAYKILQKHFSTSDNISLAEVNKFLDTLADKYKNSKQRKSPATFTSCQLVSLISIQVNRRRRC